MCHRKLMTCAPSFIAEEANMECISIPIYQSQGRRCGVVVMYPREQALLYMFLIDDWIGDKFWTS